MEVHSSDGAYLRRLAIVLPLQVSNNIVPIPFILNTGATGSVYSGTGTLYTV